MLNGKFKCVSKRLWNNRRMVTVGKIYEFKDGRVIFDDGRESLKYDSLRHFNDCNTNMLFKEVKSSNLPSLKELAEKNTRIKFEDEQDKKEFLEWYIAEGGSDSSNRHDIRDLDGANGVEVWAESFEIARRNWADDEHNTTWKQLKGNKNNNLTEIKWDGRSAIKNCHIEIYPCCNYIAIKIHNHNSISKHGDIIIRINGIYNTTLEEANQILALYGYKIVIEEPKLYDSNGNELFEGDAVLLCDGDLYKTSYIKRSSVACYGLVIDGWAGRYCSKLIKEDGLKVYKISALVDKEIDNENNS